MMVDGSFQGRWISRLARWVEYRPVTASEGASRLAGELATELVGLGFDVERSPSVDGDLIVAHHFAADGPCLGIYGHYDVVEGGSSRLEVANGRVRGRGVADNLGPLALRLEVLLTMRPRGRIAWLIEPGEENGSRSVAAWCDHARRLDVDLWLDETGYFDRDGTQRLLSVHEDRRLERAVDVVGGVALDAGRGVRRERRRLRRASVDAVPAVERLFGARPYLALGPNDDGSDVHGEDESILLTNAMLAARQFAALLTWSSGERS